MLFGGRLGISRSANVDFDREAEGRGLGHYLGKIFESFLGI